jgi:hypothetical protein
MAPLSKKSDPRFILGIVFIAAGIPIISASVAVGVVMIVVGGVLMASAVAAAKKARAADEKIVKE